MRCCAWGNRLPPWASAKRPARRSRKSCASIRAPPWRSGKASNVSKKAAAPEDASPLPPAEADAHFDGLSSAPALVLAVSGGPDSTALMVLAARWRAALRRGPELLAVTVDHALRPESAREARAV